MNATRYIDGKPAADHVPDVEEAPAPSVRTRDRRDPLPACYGVCGRQVRLSIFSGHGALVEAGRSRQLSAEEVGAVLAFVDGLPR